MKKRPAVLDITKVRDNVLVIHNDVVPGNVVALVAGEGVLPVDDTSEIGKMLRSEFNRADLHLQVGLDGMLAERARL